MSFDRFPDVYPFSHVQAIKRASWQKKIRCIITDMKALRLGKKGYG